MNQIFHMWMVYTLQIFISDCFDYDAKATGNKVIREKHYFQDVRNAKDCQKICQQSMTCKYFVYNLINKSCNLKSEGASKTKESKLQFIFGPRNCKGTTTLFILCLSIIYYFIVKTQLYLICFRYLHMCAQDLLLSEALCKRRLWILFSRKC